MKKLAIIVLPVVMFLLTAGLSSAIEINPPILQITGKSGDFVLQSVEIYNDRDSDTVVNVSIAGISNYYLPRSTYILKPYERKTITIGFTVSGSANGFITYEYNGEVLTQIVSISSEKSVIIFPQNPKAGTSIAIVTTSDEKANGFLFVSGTGKQYPVILSGMPITFVNISKDDYGSAMLVLVWEDKEVTYNYINITKAKSTSEEKLSIDFGGDKTVKYGTTRIISMKYGDSPVDGNFIIIKPNGDQILKDANSLGQISITFNQAGKWTFIANYQGKTVTDIVNVKKGSVSLSVPDKSFVGDEVEIKVSEDSGNFTITTPKGEKIDGEFSDGKITFTPDEAGEYSIEVNCGGAEDTDSFRVYHEPVIVFSSGFVQVNSLKEGKTYDVVVKDRNTGDIIDGVNYIIASHNGISEYIYLSNGVGKFTPKKGYYTLSISRDDRNYVGAYTSYISVYGAGGGGSFDVFIYIIVILIIVVILVYLYKKGKLPLPTKPPQLER